MNTTETHFLYMTGLVAAPSLHVGIVSIAETRGRLLTDRARRDLGRDASFCLTRSSGRVA